MGRAVVFEKKRASLQAWQDRLRDPSLTALLVLQIFLLFVAVPLAATGVPMAQPVAWALLLVAVTLGGVLSSRVGASVFILLGLAAAATSFAFGREWSPITASALDHSGFMLAFSALVWVVAHANAFARSLANLESVIGPFYLAITVARLVTMELDDRRRSRQ